MTDTDTLGIPSPRKVIQSNLRAMANTKTRFHNLGRILVFAGLLGIVVMGVLVAAVVVPEWLRATVVSSAAVAVLVGAILWVASILLASHLAHYHAFRFETAELAEGMDKAAIGRLAAMMEQHYLMLREVHDALVATYSRGQALNGHQAEPVVEDGADSQENVVRMPTPETVRVLERFARRIAYPQKPPQD